MALVTSRDARPTHSSTAQAPAARRLPRARFGDIRLWLGLALVVVSVVMGARLLNADEDTVVVLRATRDLAVGAPISALVPVQVSRAAVGDEYLAGQPDETAILRWPVTAGELVPRSAIVPQSQANVREVAVPVDPLRAPPGLAPGDLVDVWSSQAESAAGQPRLVLANARIADVATDDVGISGDMGVVLTVPAEAVASVVGASRSGVVDLVAVPIESQAPGTASTP